jgi:thiol-disulfide isomerase/thioredoxin
MRQTFFLISMCLCMLSIFAQKTPAKQFVLEGKIANSASPVIYLIYNLHGKRIIDSCELKQESFYFKGNIQEPTWAILRGNSRIMDDAENPNIVDFYLEPKTITAIVQYDHFKEIKIIGSKTQNEYELLLKKYSAIDKNSVSVEKEFSDADYQYIIQHPDSYVSANELMLRKTRWPLDSVKSLYKKLTPAIQNSTNGKMVKETIDGIDNNSAGTKAKEFKTVDISGNVLSLSGFKGKYVLLDFWGSWCVPCRQSTPHLKDLFTKYHNDGFDIIGVAEESDDTGMAWRTAIKKDGTDIWYNVLSEAKINSEKGIAASQAIVNKYGVHVFPTKILIDKTGMIIGRYTGRGDELQLDEKLHEIFK